MSIRFLYEVLPLILALMSAGLCAAAFKSDKLIFGMSIVIIILFLITQSSWIVASLIENRICDDNTINVLWTVVHSLSLIVIGLVANKTLKNKSIS